MGQQLDKPFNVHIACCNSYNLDDEDGEDNVDGADVNVNVNEVEGEVVPDSSTTPNSSSCDDNTSSHNNHEHNNELQQ